MCDVKDAGKNTGPTSSGYMNAVERYQESCRKTAKVVLAVLEGKPETPEILKCRAAAHKLLNNAGPEKPTMPTKESI